MILGMVGVPVEGIGLILGVDRFLDMCRTTLNVTGDLAAAVVVSRGEEAQEEQELGPPSAPGGSGGLVRR
jgi:DAACS family dicarboxylate/amino acid:cation (Na+ or H+) symporter